MCAISFRLPLITITKELLWNARSTKWCLLRHNWAPWHTYLPTAPVLERCCYRCGKWKFRLGRKA